MNVTSSVFASLTTHTTLHQPAPTMYEPMDVTSELFEVVRKVTSKTINSKPVKNLSPVASRPAASLQNSSPIGTSKFSPMAKKSEPVVEKPSPVASKVSGNQLVQNLSPVVRRPAESGKMSSPVVRRPAEFEKKPTPTASRSAESVEKSPLVAGGTRFSPVVNKKISPAYQAPIKRPSPVIAAASKPSPVPKSPGAVKTARPPSTPVRVTQPGKQRHPPLLFR
uniref:Uncharacterized protein n=1 Tax=Ditylenchus dipsaci TaxID=166011 RepID=A0A915EAX9_9BILA